MNLEFIAKKKIIFLSIFIFLFAFLVRIVDLNKMGRTFDETFYVSEGWNIYTAVLHKDFLSRIWIQNPDPPIVSKLLYGLGSFVDFKSMEKGSPIFHYDMTYSRLVSVILTSFLCAFVFYVGYRRFSLFVGLSSGVILSMLPFFLGFSQLVSIESPLIVAFTLAAYSYILVLEKPTKKRIVICAILSAVAIFTKYSNGLLIPLYIWLYFIRRGNVAAPKITKKSALLFFAVFAITLFVLWPQFFIHLKSILELIFELRIGYNAHSVPEVFFGRLMHVPKIYYFVQFLITTPFLLLVLFAISFVYISQLSNSKIPEVRSKKRLLHAIQRIFLLSSNAKKTTQIWFLFALTAWFVVPYIQSIYNFRQQGVRYIIQMYVPFVLLTSVGLEVLVKRLWGRSRYIYAAILVVVLYLGITLLRVRPYYIDYFNEVVGGNNNVYQKHLFHLAWWGEGLREAGKYIEKDARGKRILIGAAVTPVSSIPTNDTISAEYYDPTRTYDYVIVSFYQIHRMSFQDADVIRKYEKVYEVRVDKAPMIKVYKSKK